MMRRLIYIVILVALFGCSKSPEVLVIVGGHEYDIDLKIEVLDPTHPVTRGIGEFMIHDEGYFNIQINEEVHPLLGTKHPNCAPQVAWINQCNRSTCLYLMFGHDKVAYENEHFKLLLSNSIQWLSNPN